VNRALRAATMGALLLTPVLMTACSAGQVNQTSSQDRDKVGPGADVGDLVLRQVQLVNPCEGGDEDATAYEDGDSPELVLSIVNSGREDDTLTAIQGEAFDGVYVDEVPDTSAPTSSSAPATSAAPSTSQPESTDTTTTETPGGSQAPETSAAPTTAAPTSAAPTASTRLDVPVPAGEVTTIGLRQYEEGSPCEPEISADTTRLFLADLSLDAPLTASQTLPVTLTFAEAGDVTVQVLVAGPGGDVPRGEAFDFHEEEGAGAGNEQDTEAE
jgi:hypothetical protein